MRMDHLMSFTKIQIMEEFWFGTLTITKMYLELKSTSILLTPPLKVVGAKDYDKDGAVDILLQNTTTGEAKIVYFDTSGTELSEKDIGTVDTSVIWEIRN